MPSLNFGDSGSTDITANLSDPFSNFQNYQIQPTLTEPTYNDWSNLSDLTLTTPTISIPQMSTVPANTAPAANASSSDSDWFSRNITPILTTGINTVGTVLKAALSPAQGATPNGYVYNPATGQYQPVASAGVGSAVYNPATGQYTYPYAITQPSLTSTLFSSANMPYLLLGGGALLLFLMMGSGKNQGGSK